MNKRDVITKEDLEEYYNKCRKIRFGDDVKEVNYNSLKAIFDNIRNANESLATFYIKGGHHCNRKKIRSLDDYIRLCKYYFPNCTLKDILQTIMDNREITYTNWMGKESDGVIYLTYCNQIRKDNFNIISCVVNNQYYDINNKSFYSQGFPNCTIKIKDILE